MKPVVSLVRYSHSPESLRDAVSLCEGFRELNKNERVLIKPNLVTWDNCFKIAPFGVFTTTRLVEDLIILLKDHGCSDIAVGEGSVEMSRGIGTMHAFRGLGYVRMAKQYGLKLIDFNKGRFERITLQNGLTLKIAKEALEREFLINIPVLKTHAQSKVSLGLKNLKGCLNTSSRKLCHNADPGLEYCLPFVADYAKPSLTITDGIYVLERGAFHFGNAYRKDIIAASRDILGSDLVAAKTIGFDTPDITHFIEYARRHGKSLDLRDYEIRGERLEDHITRLKWDWGWTTDNTGPSIFEKFGLTGIAVPKYDETLCSGCSPFANMVNILVLSSFKGHALPRIEILNGKKMQARPGYEKTILIGNCIIKANRTNQNIKEPVNVRGCPPPAEYIITALRESGLDINESAYYGYLTQQGEKYDNREGYDLNLYQ